MSLDKVFSTLKTGRGRGNWDHQGIPGHQGGSLPGGGSSGMNEEEVYQDAARDVSDVKKSLRKKYMAASSNNLTVKAAKQVAKERKLKFQGILKLFTPSDNMSGDVTWDKEGELRKT